MRIVSKLIAYSVAVLTLTAVLFSIVQSYREERRFDKELYQHTLNYSSELQSILGPLARNAPLDPLRAKTEEFATSRKLTGVVIEDSAGRSLVVSKQPLAQLHRSKVDSVPLDLGARRMTLTVFHDAEPMFKRFQRIWLANFLRLLVQIALVSLVIFLVVYFNILSPLRLMAQWAKNVRLGQGPDIAPPSTPGEKILGSLANEITQIGRSLSSARQQAEEEARLRHFSESMWTPARLKEFVKTKLNGRSIFVVSNREPYRHQQKGKEITYEVPASGLVTAIEPILKACGGTWIAEGDGDADRLTADDHNRLRVPPDDPQYFLRRVWVSKEEQQGYYYGFANEGLWPLCHIAHTRPIFRPTDWQQYEIVNERFAEAVLDEIEGVEMPYILIQDYHFALLPEKIKSKRPDARVAIFWHIPWPNPESFGICPWQRQLLKGMLGADIIGFHTQFHCNNFLDTVDRFLEARIDRESFSVHREGQTTWVKPFPISIAFIEGETRSNLVVTTSKEALLNPYGISADHIGVGVDRMDYTKGILERFRAVEHFLEKNPAYIEKFTFVELAAPSRSLIEKYQEFSADVEREAERINARFKGRNWKPILLLIKNHTHEEIAPFYQAADLCMVTSLHDGMNLVAKEFVMSRADEKGALILSQFTGAARELTDALIVNPYDIEQMADAIGRSLRMPAPEQRERMRAMRTVLRERNVYRWAAELVGELARIRVSPMVMPEKVAV